jgi:hypothetical protein
MDNYWLIGILAVFLFFYMCGGKIEQFIPIWSASHHNGFNVYDNAVMRGGSVYSSIPAMEQGGCRDACKKRWTTDYARCDAYNYNKATKDCDLLEYNGAYGGGIVPGEEAGAESGYNYNNSAMPHTYSFQA